MSVSLPRPLAPYACHPEHSRGRLYPEPESKYRTAHLRDRDRIIHSGAFRRLQYKTQVFVYHEGDYFRTRLTHTLEVAQITRALSRSMGLNEDLAEALALAHDLGHTPFAHAGEEELDHLMRDAGGFEHNDQTLRILTRLERRYPAFNGLNLTWEVLEGTVKHNGPLLDRQSAPLKGRLPTTIDAFQAAWDLGLDRWPSAEAQLASLCDDIAYNNHDLDDGLRSGLLTLEMLDGVPITGACLAAVRREHPGLDENRTIQEMVRRVMDLMVADLLAETERRLAALQPATPDDIRQADLATIAFSPGFWDGQVAPLRAFLHANVYRHYRVSRMRHKIRRVVRELFELFIDSPQLMPPDFHHEQGLEDPTQRARLVADYIAGMTDRFALEEHHRLFDPMAKT